MSETFRPATLGEILDRTAQIYRRSFMLFVGVAALPIGVIVGVSALAAAIWKAFFSSITINNFGTSGALAVLIVSMVLVALPVYIAAAVFSYAALTGAAANAHRGEGFTVRSALAAVKPRFWRYLWFLILQGIVIGFIPAATAVVVITGLLYMAPGAGTAAGLALGFVAFVTGAAAFVIIVWLVLGYSLGFPVCVIEDKAAWESLQRAWKLSQGTRGRILVMYLLVIALSFAVSMLSAIPTMIVIFIAAARGGGAAQSSTAFIAAEVVRVVMDFVLQVLIAPVSAIALVLFYYDQRVRKEGFDIEWMMQQAGLAQPISTMQPIEGAGTPPIEGAGISGPIGPPDTVKEP
jgi:hypothetical protein